MKLVVLITVFVSLPYVITASNIGLEKRQYENLGFSCGTWQFQEPAIKEAVDEALKVNRKRKTINGAYPLRYQGPLFGENHGLMIWPLRVDGIIHNSKYSLSAVKGVIARLFDQKFIKCTRITQPNSEISSGVELVPNSDMGYDCGYEIFPDKLILKWMHWIESNLESDSRYPTPFDGKLYAKELRYLISPIRKKGRPLESNKLKGTYFIVISSEGKFIEMIAKMKIGDYIRCQRVAQMNNESFRGKKSQGNPQAVLQKLSPVKPQKPSEKLSEEPSDEISEELSEEDPPRPTVSFLEMGFLCGQEFFPTSYLRASAKLARTSSFRATMKKKPKKYTGPPYNKNYWLWSIFPEKNLYAIGRSAKHSLVLDQSFQIVSVMVRSLDKFEICEETTRRSEQILLEIDSFECEQVLFSSEWLQMVAYNVCPKIYDGIFLYPAPYKGPKFDIPGPYFTYPLFEESSLNEETGNYRIVINLNCMVAGVLEFKRAKIKGSLRSSTLSKCKRHTDLSIPGKISGLISEVL